MSDVDPYEGCRCEVKPVPHWHIGDGPCLCGCPEYRRATPPMKVIIK